MSYIKSKDERDTNVWFWCTELELDQSNLGLFYPRRPANGCNDILVQDHTLNQLGVFDGSANFLDNTDIAKVNIRGCGGDKTSHCRYSDGGKGRGVL